MRKIAENKTVAQAVRMLQKDPLKRVALTDTVRSTGFMLGSETNDNCSLKEVEIIEGILYIHDELIFKQWKPVARELVNKCFFIYDISDLKEQPPPAKE